MPGTRYSAKLGKSNDRVSNEQQQRQTWLNPDNNAEEDSSTVHSTFTRSYLSLRVVTRLNREPRVIEISSSVRGLVRSLPPQKYPLE